MPGRVSRRRLVVAALLVALAVLPNAVHVYAAVWYYYVPTSLVAWVQVHLPMSPRPWLRLDVESLESVKAITSGWESYRRLWFLFALVAGVIVVRELVPVPRAFGHEDE
jgi:hypothetical protein